MSPRINFMSLSYTVLLIVAMLDLGSAWLYPCKRLGWGSYTLHKHCTLEDVVIKDETPLYRIFFPPVDLEIRSGFIPSFGKAVAERMSARTKRLTINFCGVESVFLRDTLEYVVMNYNQLSEVQFDSAQGLQVWSLHLSYNHLRDIEFVRDIKSLVILIASKNLISSVRWETFENLHRLATLDLAGNLIQQIDGKTNLPVLKRLVLAENSIIDLGIQDVTMESLRELNVSHNILASVNLFDFRRTFPVLEKIDVRQNLWNCERLKQLESLMILEKLMKRESFNADIQNCHTDQLESISFGTPETIHKLQSYLDEMQNLYQEQISNHDTNGRLYMAQEIASYVDEDLARINSSLVKLNHKVARLFQQYNFSKYNIVK